MSITESICRKITEYLQSEEVTSALKQVYSEPFSVQQRWSFVEDSADLETMDVSVIPGTLMMNKLGRDAMEGNFQVAVQLCRRISEMEEMSENVAFFETLIRYLSRLGAIREIEGCRGVEMVSLESESLYAHKEIEGTRVYDSLLVLNMRIYYKKGE